jgi:hypothetical protein
MVMDSANYPLIELPSLVSLVVSIRGPLGNLRFLNLPALEILTANGSTHDIITRLTENHLLYPLVRSFTLIVEYMYDKDVSVEMVLDLISLLPNVRTIAFHGAHLGSAL